MDIIEGSAGEILLGLLIGSLALAFPFRRAVSRPRLLRDIVAAGASAAFVIGTGALLDIPEGAVIERLDRWYALLRPTSFWLVVPAYIVLADFGSYWAHRALHSRWLWPTHAWHHSPRHLNWISGLRGSPVHMILIGAPSYIAFALFPVPEAGAIAAVLFVIGTSNQHYIHSNLKVPSAERLERVLVTPRFHFVHHSAKEHVGNSNYGFVFSVWDRLFGTYTDPRTVPDDDPLGLDYEVSAWRLVLGLPPARAGAAGERTARVDYATRSVQRE